MTSLMWHLYRQFLQHRLNPKAVQRAVTNTAAPLMSTAACLASRVAEPLPWQPATLRQAAASPAVCRPNHGLRVAFRVV